MADELKELNYRKLLMAYMDNVIGCEGESFVNKEPPFKTRMTELTDGEREELRRIERELTAIERLE
jgi:hypothetical protein